MEIITEHPMKNLNFFDVPRVSPDAHPLTKKPEDSGYEITWKLEFYLNFWIGGPVAACIAFPKKSCGHKIPVPESLFWRSTAGERA